MECMDTLEDTRKHGADSFEKAVFQGGCRMLTMVMIASQWCSVSKI